MSRSASLCGAAVQADTWTPVPLGPHYKVEAVRLRCNHETWYDWVASDEVRVGIGTPTITTISKVFTDVDAGETRTFAPDQSCIHPIDGKGRIANSVFEPSESWICSNSGAPGPISFTVVMAEEDRGFFHDCFIGGDCVFYSPSRPLDPNDELIGQHTVEFTPEQLAFAMPNVGDFIEPVITLRPPDDGGNSAGGTAAADYTFTYRVTRVAPGPLMSDREVQPATPPQ